MKRVGGLMAALLFLTIFTCSCSAKKERTELVNFAKLIESSKPSGNAIMDRFNDLPAKYKSNPNPQQMALDISQLVVDIDTLVEPAKKMSPKSEEVARILDEYIFMWENLQDALRMILEVMVSGDPRLGATLEKRLMEKDAARQAAIAKFESDYIIISRRHNLKPEEIGVSVMPPMIPAPQPFSGPTAAPGPFEIK